MLAMFEARFMVRVPKLLFLAALSMIPSAILRSSDNPEVQIGPRAKTPPGSNSPFASTSLKVADLFQLNLNPYARNNPPNAVEPTGRAIDTDDLSNKDKMLWQKVVDLANTQDEDGNYVNPVLYATYAAL